MTKIVRILYASRTVNLLDGRGAIKKRFTYGAWQKWLRKNGSVTFPFIYNPKSKKAEFVQ
mgnify:CR=1 FL=1|jgi:hypothetical protein